MNNLVEQTQRLNSCFHDAQNDQIFMFVREIFKKIEDNIRRCEFSALLDNLNALCGDSKFLKFVKDGKTGIFHIQMFFISVPQMRVVQELVRDLWQIADLEEVHEVLVGNFIDGVLVGDRISGLAFSYLHMNLIFGTDHFHTFFTQTILRRLDELQKESRSMMKLSNEFLFQLCTYLPIKELGRFSRTNRKVNELINLDENNLIWRAVADNFNVKINLSFTKSIKAQVADPWDEKPFGRMNRDTYDVIVSRTRIPPLGQFNLLYNMICSISNSCIPKGYYFIFKYKFPGNCPVMCFVFVKNDEVGILPPHICKEIELTKTIEHIGEKLPETMKYCYGKCEDKDEG